MIVRGAVEQPFLPGLQALGKYQVQAAVPDPLQQLLLRGERPDAGAPQPPAQGVGQVVLEAPALLFPVDVGQGRVIVREAHMQGLACRGRRREAEA